MLSKLSYCFTNKLKHDNNTKYDIIKWFFPKSDQQQAPFIKSI